MTYTLFLQPLDVLFLRGNKLFDGPGSYGESLMPPWPSVAAGALRSRMLADEGIDLPAFGRGEITHPTLGTPKAPGSFAITGFQLGRQVKGKAPEPLYALPADLIAEGSGDGLRLERLQPTMLATGLQCSAALSQIPVLAQVTRSKPKVGVWLTAAGWQRYLQGQTPRADQLVKTSELWGLDPRVGVALDAATGRADDGKLFSVQAICFKPGVGFIAAANTPLPQDGMVRLGGDGGAAAISPIQVSALPEPDYAAIAKAGRCRVVLTSPGLFSKGWELPGQGERGQLEWQGVSATVVAAAASRAETISGWDLANWQPKPAQRAAPAGSVYWLENLQTTPDALRNISNLGLWAECGQALDPARRAEGFNRCTFAIY